jgi:microcystin-dependent protein
MGCFHQEVKEVAMSEPFIGEIRMFSGNFAPRGWALCEGQLLSVEDNQSLYALLGTNYGGNGRDTFGLPDMRGRIPVGDGYGEGLTVRRQGEQFGTEIQALTIQNIPPHKHSFMASQDLADSNEPAGNVLANTGEKVFYENIDPNDPADIIVPLTKESIQATGGNQAHSNLMPALCINFIIALGGIFPSRS